MSAPLYVLAAEYRKLTEALDREFEDSGGEITEGTEALDAALGELGVSIQDKVENIGKILANLDATAEAINAEEVRLIKRRQSIDKKHARLKEYLRLAITASGMKKVQGPLFTATIRAGSESVKLADDFDVRKLPQNLVRQPPTPPPEPDKKAIKEALKANEVVPGCSLHTGPTTVIIK